MRYIISHGSRVTLCDGDDNGRQIAIFADSSGCSRESEDAENLMAAIENACIWKWTDLPNNWATSCGGQFSIEDTTPSENNMEYCCFCGKKIREDYEK